MVSMSTSSHNPDLDPTLSGIQARYRSKITAAYLDLKKNHLEARIDAAGLAAGKFCEAVLRHLQFVVTGTSTPFNRRIPNFADACRQLITSPTGSASESERTVIPRALIFAYTMRNKRGIGHVGGDVDANRIDLAVLSAVADWVVCELIRLYHGLSLEEAQDLVDGISIRRLPAIWEVAGRKRVLQDGLSAKDQVLLILYSSKDSILVEDLLAWVEYKRMDHFKHKVLKPLHDKRLIEFDRESDCIHLSPKGASDVEERLLNGNSPS